MAAAEDTVQPTRSIWELQQAKNIEPLLDPEESDRIGREVVEGYDIDKRSRREWEDRMENAVKLALQMVEKKNWPWPGASNVKFPLVTIAALQFSARAYPALVKGPDLVKYRITGKDQDGQKAARAQRVGTHMSYQLLEQDEDWEEDFDRALIALPILGTVFKKSFFSHVDGHNKSKLVLPQNLVVSYYARSTEECERKTEEFELYDREIRERQLRGVYSEKELHHVQTRPSPLSDQRQGLTEPTQDRKKARPLLEQHCYLDLDGDEYPEPYVVTVDHSSRKVLRIVSRFAQVHTKQSIELERLTDQFKLLEAQVAAIVARLPQPNGQENAQAIRAAQEAEQQILAIREQQEALREQMRALADANQESPEVVRIDVEEHYTKYGFIPSPDGGFYELGLGALLGPLNDSVNTLVNQLIDSGTLNNGSHGFIGRGARIQGGKIRFTDPFEWKRVNVAGQTLRDSLVPLPVNQPSPVLFNLLSMLVTYAERVSSVNEAMSGSNPGQNTPAYNYHAMLEQGLQVFNGIFKRLYRSFRKELKKLYLLNRTYLNPIEYYETIDGPAQVLQNDYQGDVKDIVPAADPNAFSNMESLMKAHFLAERAATVPGYAAPQVERRLLEAMDIPDVQEIYPTDEQGNPVIPPPQNPEIEIKKAEEQRRTIESQARMNVDAAEAESKIDLNESQIVLNQVKAQTMDQDSAVKRFEAIAERFEKRRDQMLEQMKILKESRETNSGTD